MQRSTGSKWKQADPAHPGLGDAALWLNIATLALVLVIAVVVLVARLGGHLDWWS
jgi:hypothetical protein